MAFGNFPSDSDLVRQALERELRDRLDKEIAAAVPLIQAKLAERVGTMVIGLMKQYEISRMGETLHIKVQLIGGGE